MGDSWNGQGPIQSTGSLKTKISLKAGASYSVVAPFYTMKPDLPPTSGILGSRDLLSVYDLGSTYTRFCGSKKMREDLASFLPHIYGNFTISPTQDISSLKMLVEKPPLTGKEICPLTSSALNGFRLAPGPVDERYRSLFEQRRDDSDVLQGEADSRESNFFRYKNSLEPLDGDHERDDSERRKHKSEKKEKKKKKDKKKKDKKDDEKKHRKSAVDGSSLV